ncbi:MAG: hypothetical protein ACOC55_02180 [Candidatus Natronoplasma sp.]
MSFPIISDKVKEEAYISPEDSIDYWIEDFDRSIPKGVVLCYQSKVLNLAKEEHDFSEEEL